MFRNIFYNELSNNNTNYFIIDTNSNDTDWDIDFKVYSWETNRYNQVREGDLFLYRRPQRTSENGMFYFFGAGKIETIKNLENHKVAATISKAYPFNDYVYPKELEDYSWEFRERKNNWANFFNQYGMNKITKNDFLKVIGLSECDNEIIDNSNLVDDLEEIQKIKDKDYRSDNIQSYVNVRKGHGPFANQIKRNYSVKCAICSISTKDFLIASHIIPWAKDKNNRLNPQNAICLCSFHDKAFDKGYISISNDYKVIVSDNIKDDILSNELKKYENQKIHLPSIMKPDKSFLDYHRLNILKKTFN